MDVAIADPGIGIDADQQKIILKVSVRSKRTMSGTMTAWVSGLYLVRHLLALLGHEVTIDSKLGEGPQFTILLPFNSAG